MMYYEAAAYLDSPAGHFSYGASMANNHEEPDVELAILHLSRAIAHGHIRAMNFLAHGLYDAYSWFHHHRRESIHHHRQNLSQWNPHPHTGTPSKPRLKEWLNLSSSDQGRYRVLEVNLSNPIRLELALPDQYVRLDLAYPIILSPSDTVKNLSPDSVHLSTPRRRYYENKHVRWIGADEGSGQSLKLCEVIYKLVKHLAEYHPYGASLSTLTTSTLAPLLQSSASASAMDPFGGGGGLGDGSSEEALDNAMTNAISMIDLLDEGAELGYQQLQWQSYHLHHRIMSDYCPLLPLTSPSMNQSFGRALGTTNHTESRFLSRYIITPLWSRFRGFVVRLLETKFRVGQEEQYGDHIVYTERDELADQHLLDSLPTWLANMTSEACREYFMHMSMKRLIQLSNQGSTSAKRLLASMIISEATSQPQPLASSNSSSSLMHQAILLLISSAEQNDLEALLELGWLLYYDNDDDMMANELDSKRRQKLAEEVFAMAHDLELQRSTRGILSSIAFLCLYTIQVYRSMWRRYESSDASAGLSMVDKESIWIIVLSVALISLTTIYFQRRWITRLD
jgi:hypothetical protein